MGEIKTRANKTCSTVIIFQNLDQLENVWKRFNSKTYKWLLMWLNSRSSDELLKSPWVMHINPFTTRYHFSLIQINEWKSPLKLLSVERVKLQFHISTVFENVLKQQRTHVGVTLNWHAFRILLTNRCLSRRVLWRSMNLSRLLTCSHPYFTPNFANFNRICHCYL